MRYALGLIAAIAFNIVSVYASSEQDPLRSVIKELHTIALPDGRSLFGEPVLGVRKIGIETTKDTFVYYYGNDEFNSVINSVITSFEKMILNPVKTPGGLFSTTEFFSPQEILQPFCKIVSAAYYGNLPAILFFKSLFRSGTLGETPVLGLPAQPDRFKEWDLIKDRAFLHPRYHGYEFIQTYVFEPSNKLWRDAYEVATQKAVHDDSDVADHSSTSSSNEGLRRRGHQSAPDASTTEDDDDEHNSDNSTDSTSLLNHANKTAV